MLTFNLKKEWFEKIKSGEKTHEYREMTDSWQKKLVPTSFWLDYFPNLKIPITSKTQYCIFCLGYPPTKKNPEKAKTRVLYAKILSIKANVDGQKTDLAEINPNVEDVFDIEFELIERGKNYDKEHHQETRRNTLKEKTGQLSFNFTSQEAR